MTKLCLKIVGNYFVYSRTGSVSNVLMVIIVSLIFTLAFILSDIDYKGQRIRRYKIRFKRNKEAYI